MRDKPLINCLEETGWSVTLCTLASADINSSRPVHLRTAVSLSSHVYDSEWHILYHSSLTLPEGALGTTHSTTNPVSITYPTSTTLRYSVPIVIPFGDQHHIHSVLLGTDEYRRLVSTYSPDTVLSPSRPDAYTAISHHRELFLEFFADLAYRQEGQPFLVVQNSFFSGCDDPLFTTAYQCVDQPIHKNDHTETSTPEFFLAKHLKGSSSKLCDGEFVYLQRTGLFVPWKTAVVAPLQPSDLDKAALTSRIKRLVGYGFHSHQ